MKAVTFSREQLKLDPVQEVRRVETVLRELVIKQLKRKGVVVGLSGGIDSSVTAALSVRALGKDRVLGLLMPEEDSSEESLRLGRLIANHLGIHAELEDIGPILRAAGCYRRRDEAIRKVLAEYQDGYKCKLILPNIFETHGYSIFHIVAESPSGIRTKARLSAEAYLGIVAATNFKQRTRKMMEYYYADLFHYAVGGTPNRLEYDQGFFVKNGDGAADIKPIAHLYKTQVYQVAEYLQIPEEIRTNPPTTDTYPLQQSQEEFYFSVPYVTLDLCLYGKNHGISALEVAPVAGLTPEQVGRVYQDIDSKRNATRYLHLKPFLIEDVKEVRY